MPRDCKLLTIIFILLFAVLPRVAFSQDNISVPILENAPQSLKAGVYVSPPFVMVGKDQFTGMAIDLWETLATDLNFQTEYTEYETFRDLVNATKTGEIDVAVTNLTISKERAKLIDFTHPWFDAGLRVMINEEPATGFGQVFKGLQSSGHLRAYLWIAVIIFLSSVLLTIFDRRFDKSFSKSWREGFAESFYTVMSVTTSGKPPSRKNLFGWFGRIWQGLWLVCGIAVLAYVTSSVTSVMTTLSLTNQINSVSDLGGRRVGVMTGSIAEEYARHHSINARVYPHMEEAIQALKSDQVLAIIGDAPVLEYYAHTNPSTQVQVVGPIFEPDKYGFSLAHDSPLTRPLTVELIGAHESGLITEIRKKYFGND